ncbi:protein insensitive-like [Papilio machaon]|uniref:protein insensitive-like n=1 Tax=Papilio machaon TaxID=76193 RepID=UPI001E663096|nr:protein insensitive-like [Papilio machaon]
MVATGRQQTSYMRNSISSYVESDFESPKKKSKKNVTPHGIRLYNKKPLKIKNKSNLNSDLVPIGDGHALIPNRLLKHMDWTSYTNATRKLLRAVFSRSVLATHSLTGKPSPAFPNKPAKKQLNPMLVNDIVQTVVDNCRVPESVVRTSITTKCADESKMLRSRMRKNKRDCDIIDRENISPSDSKSDDSDDSFYSD